MKIAELLLAELDREAVGIRKTLERVPEGKNDLETAFEIYQLRQELGLGRHEKAARIRIAPLDEAMRLIRTGEQMPCRRQLFSLSLHGKKLK
jgi:hypothetical protein